MNCKKTLLVIPVVLLSFIGCKKNFLKVSEFKAPDSSAYIKIAYLSNPVRNTSVQVKVNGERVSNLISYATGFPGGGTNITGSNVNDYLPVKVGSTITFTIPNTGTNNDSVMLYTTTLNLGVNERHTLFVVDTLPNVTSFTVKDEQQRPDSGNISLRFIHAMPNVPAVDLYKNQTLLASNIAYKSATAYLTTPVGNSDTFKIRTAGAAATATPIVTRPFATANQRVYNFLSRGYTGGSPAARGPQLSSLLIW